MDSKKFVILSPNYKEFLSKVEPILKDIELSPSTPMTQLQQVYDKITELIGGNIERNDINNMLINCNNSNPILGKLKDFVYLRNVRILEKAIKHDKYKDFVSKIQHGGSYSSRNVDSAFFKLVNPYFNYWDGLWRFIDFGKGKVRSVDVLDPSDIKQLNGYLNK